LRGLDDASAWPARTVERRQAESAVDTAANVAIDTAANENSGPFKITPADR
jgi:hypothetical protein